MSDCWTTARNSLQLEERMHLDNIPAASVAIIHDGKLDLETGIGQLAADDPTPATENTCFAACSISKAVTASAVLRLIAAGKLQLDTDIHDTLRDWRLNDGNGRPVKITLRQLLTHTAGINPEGADGYDPRGPVPTLEQILRGQPPCITPPVRIIQEPGAAYNYCMGGYLLIEKLICDVTGESFDAAMRRLVFAPLAMTHSTFRDHAGGMQRASAHVSMIRRGAPESDLVWRAAAAAGLWTTAGDLARLVLAIQGSYDGRDDFLPQDLARQMLTQQTPHRAIGLGVYLLGEGPARRFSHTGAYLGFKGEVLGWLEGGYGIAVMVNNGYTGLPLKEEIIAAVARAYGWPM
jgi:CubicO group peptidase (beta-lactamase class C family)